jgi:hypothetical protein
LRRKGNTSNTRTPRQRTPPKAHHQILPPQHHKGRRLTARCFADSSPPSPLYAQTATTSKTTTKPPMSKSNLANKIQWVKTELPLETNPCQNYCRKVTGANTSIIAERKSSTITNQKPWKLPKQYISDTKHHHSKASTPSLKHQKIPETEKELRR